MTCINRIAPSFVLFLCFAFSQSGSAQTQQAQPVARLLPAPSDAVTLTRPRRVFAPSNSAISSATSREANDLERRTFERVNSVRSQRGLAALEWDSDLFRMARMHSANMAQQAFLSHKSPDGLRPRDRARAVGIRHFRVLAENIAYNRGVEDPGAFAVEQWMTSPAHRVNILDAEFVQSAIGCYAAADGRVYLTQVFIAR